MISTSGSDSSSATAVAMPTLPVTKDTKGRVRTSREKRRVILTEFERGGVNVQSELQTRLAEADRLRQQQVQRAQYEVDRARVRYMRVDPNNRLVGRYTGGAVE